LLVLLAAEFADPSAPGIVPSALVVELTHVATLYHDDVMDEATMRRGAPSANTNWSNSVAILVGDFLFAQASTIVADLGPDAVRLQARTFARLVQGQIRETQGPDDPQSALDHYLRVVADKTGSLISTSALFGARLSGASEPVQVAMRDFGERIGTAFQLADDIIDVASTQDKLGKAPGTDLREGVPTLPALVAMASPDPSDGRLRELLSRPLTDDAEHAEGLTLLRAHPAMESSYAYVQREADAARALLVGLPDIPLAMRSRRSATPSSPAPPDPRLPPRPSASCAPPIRGFGTVGPPVLLTVRRGRAAARSTGYRRTPRWRGRAAETARTG
jgi:heptaprenyl diphosphate synthase